jgi:fumarate reductase flavoprotein subunit
MDEEKRIAGVVAQNSEGQTIRVNAPVVIVAGGSYANNKEMVQEYTDLKFEPHSIVDMQQTGDHLQMAWDTGASKDGMGVLMAIPSVPQEKPTSHLWAAAIQPHLWINQEGERFCDESIAFYFPIAANALAKQPGGVMYTIFDETSKNLMIKDGIDVSLGVFVPVTTKLNRLDDDLAKGIEEGKAFAANTIEELASQLGIKSQTLQTTVDEVNLCFQKNHDMIFAKNRKYLQPVKTAKYYAVKSSFHIFTTLGGILINQKTEAMNEKHEIIPGLFAVGNCAGGMYGWDYDIFSTGGALGFAVNSGRIAGENALEYIDKR